MSAKQGPGPNFDIIDKTFRALPPEVLDKVITDMRRELGLSKELIQIAYFARNELTGKTTI